jgi:hypothetical protein
VSSLASSVNLKSHLHYRVNKTVQVSTDEDIIEDKDEQRSPSFVKYVDRTKVIVGYSDGVIDILYCGDLFHDDVDSQINAKLNRALVLVRIDAHSKRTNTTSRTEQTGTTDKSKKKIKYGISACHLCSWIDSSPCLGGGAYEYEIITAGMICSSIENSKQAYQPFIIISNA